MEAVELERVSSRLGWAPDLTTRRSVYLGVTARQAPSRCLSAEDVLGFCDNQLGATRLERVQRHLEVCPLCMESVARAAQQWAGLGPADLLEVANNFRQGETVGGRFQIVRFLARGGMGEVYEALDIRLAERVALKAVLATACDSRRILAGFRREARIGRRIRHPNVCRVHEAAPAERARRARRVPFFTMDLVQGETLSARLRSRGPLSSREVGALGRELLLGLRAIHDSGVLHLDFKSNNIMLSAAEGACHPVILDFGLARRVSATRPLQRERPFAGSLPYMPLEQLLGATPGVQNDVFAFGVVLFEMLTGRLPFPPTPSSAQSSIVQRRAAHPPRPSTLVGGVDKWLDDVVLCCLAEPEQRHADVDAVLACWAA